MNDDLFRSLLAYKSIMAQAKILLRRRIITRREYTYFDTMFTKKYGLSLDSIFRERSLECYTLSRVDKNPKN